jgi:hypothetical protein
MLKNIAFVLEMFSLQSDLHTQDYGEGHKLNMTYIEYAVCILTSRTELFSAHDR